MELELLDGNDGGARTYRIRDASCGLEAWLVIDALVGGRSFGGIRRLPYASGDDARADAVRLARDMSRKLAFAGMPAGGAKAALIDTPALDRAAAYTRIGEVVESLGGAWFSGPDMGTGEAELDHVRSATAHVNAPGNAPGPATARGVLAGIRAALAHRRGSSTLRGRSFAIQGLGSVGAALARAIASAGGAVTGADLLDGRPCPGTRVAPDEVDAVACDVFAPCATGGTLDAAAAKRLAATVVCGSANCQLAVPGIARVLHERGVTWVPDFCVNAGAVVEGVLVELEGAGSERVDAVIEATEDRVRRLLETAGDDRLPLEVALETIGEGTS